MFHKLRLKLTLTNATVIVLLFLFLITATYYYAHEKIILLSDDLSSRILMEIKSGNANNIRLPHNHEMPPPDANRTAPTPPIPPDKPLILPDRPPGPNFFFVILSPNGSIVTQSNNPPLASERLNELVARTLAISTEKGSIIFNENEYRYIKSPMDTGPNTIILFQDFTHENDILRIQLTALGLAGLICLILSLLGSFWMASRAMIPIQQAWKQQKEFLSDASHELRTPLTVIQTNLDVVLDSQDETVASQVKWLNNIQEESTKMAKLVDSLLFLARADSNQQLLNKTSFSLSMAVKEAAAPFEPLAADKGLALSVDAKPELTIYGDKDRLKQVICIFIDNAIRHTTSGTISLKLTQAAQNAILTITDSGEGIDPEYLDKIFDRFFQVDKARSKGGAGLGLAIAKSIVENHAGSISVNSTPGFGTSFTILLPL